MGKTGAISSFNGTQPGFLVGYSRRHTRLIVVAGIATGNAPGKGLATAFNQYT
jgi:hypothetical protein